MITSIFSKSKPINFLIVFIITLIAFILAHVKYSEPYINMEFVLKQTLVFIVCFFSILLVSFIVNKNKLSQDSNYEVLLYSLFLLAIPQTLLDVNSLLSNVFILLALRRILSLKSQIDIKKKLLDASVLITISALFYFWAILFFGIIFLALLFFRIVDVKNWMIPIFGFLSVLLITQCYSILLNNEFILLPALNTDVSLNFNTYNSIQFIVAFTLFLSLGIWSSFYYLKTIKKKMKKIRPSFNILFSVAIIALVIAILSPEKASGELVFLYAPLAIIITNYIETIEEKWFKEVLLSVFVLAPIIPLLL